MARIHRGSEPHQVYRLHRDAVERLARAQRGEAPKFSREELERYRSGPRWKLPPWGKALLLKAWFAGSVCFFIFWGLSAYMGAQLDLLLVFGLAMGLVTDLLTNNALRYFAETPGENDAFLMFPRRSYGSFLGNLLYAPWLLVCVMALYAVGNLALQALRGPEAAPLGVEPILFGLLYALVDFLFLGAKRLAGQILADAKASHPS